MAELWHSQLCFKQSYLIYLKLITNYYLPEKKGPLNWPGPSTREIRLMQVETLRSLSPFICFGSFLSVPARLAGLPELSSPSLGPPSRGRFFSPSPDPVGQMVQFAFSPCLLFIVKAPPNLHTIQSMMFSQSPFLNWNMNLTESVTYGALPVFSSLKKKKDNNAKITPMWASFRWLMSLMI